MFTVRPSTLGGAFGSAVSLAIRGIAKKPAAEAIPRASMTTEDLVSSHVGKNSEGKNILIYANGIREVFKIVDEGALDIRKLSEMTTKSSVHELIANVTFDGEWEERHTEQYHEFQFRDRIWLMTKRIQNTRYSSLKYQIVNFQLPNDGFVYSPKYSAGEDELKLGHEEVTQFLGGIVSSVRKIPDFNPKLRVNYKMDESRFELYFQDEQKLKMLTVKYEPGTHLGSLANPPKTLGEWEELLQQNKKKLSLGLKNNGSN